MAAGSTYTPIATTTLGSAAASYTFSSISGSYTDLVLVASLQNTAAFVDAYVQVGNGSVDTGSNYSTTILTANGTTASSTRQTSATSAFFDYNGAPPNGTSFNAVVCNFMNYSNTTTYKTWIQRSSNGASSGGTDAIVGLWRSTSAINTIKIMVSGSNLATGSTLTLYGIAAA
jgi:hypothetical protein